MKPGFARICITPPMGTPMAGYYEERFSKGVLDDLWIHALVFDNGKTKAALVSVDSLMFSSQKCDEYRKVISEASGISEDGIFISCSHTHTGPIVGRDGFIWQGVEYTENQMLYHIRDAVCVALSDLKESKLYVAEGKAEKVAFIRRYRMKNGSVQTNPGVDNPEIDHVLGTPDESVKLLKVERDGGDDVFVVNFAVHADNVGGEYISSDFVHFLRETVENAIGNAKCMYINGAEGDVNAINTCPTANDRVGLDYDTFDGCPRSYAHARHMGRVVAGAVLQVCDKALPVGSDEIRFDEKLITIPSNAENEKLEEAKRIKELYDSGREDELPYKNMELTTAVAEAKRIVFLATGPESYSYTLTALAIGDVVFAGLPGEPFAEIGMRISDSSPFAKTFVCSLTNGGDTYFPTSSAYDEGGYEAKASRLKKGGDEIVISGMKELLEKLKA